MKDLWKKMLWVLPLLFFIACGGGSSNGSTTQNPNLKEVTVAISLPNNVSSKPNGIETEKNSLFQKVSTITEMTIDVLEGSGANLYTAKKMSYIGTRWTVTLFLDVTKAPFTFIVKGYEADGTKRYEGTRSNIQVGDLSKNIEVSVNRVYVDGEYDYLPFLNAIKVSNLEKSGKLNLKFNVGNPTKELVEYKLTTPKLPASCGSLFSPNQGNLKFTTYPTTDFDVVYSLDNNQSCRANSHELTLTNVVTKNKVTVLFTIDQGAISINFPPRVNSVKVVEDSTARTLEFSVDATDPEGDTISYAWGVVQGNFIDISNTADTPIWKIQRVDNNSLFVNIELKDEHNATAFYIYRVQGQGGGITVSNYKPVKKTGQTKSYDKNGTEVTDGSLQDDGFYQKGVTPNYTRDNVNDIVIDNITGLMWQDDARVKTVTKPWLTQANYKACKDQNITSACYDTSGNTASTYCSDKVHLGGYTWRVPTIEELKTIVDYGGQSLFINPIFHNSPLKNSSDYWSSTSIVGYEYLAWVVGFYSGDMLGYYKDVNCYVRCVRDGQ